MSQLMAPRTTMSQTDGAVPRADGPDAAALLVELVGVAGAGKTTLLKSLKQRDPRLCADVRVPQLKRLELLLRHTLRFGPLLLRSPRARWLSWHELRLMAYIEGWQSSGLEKRTRRTVFDHGPIFILALLRAFGPPLVASDAFESWWKAARSAWARALDLVVWLDAPDAVLLPRIDGRDQRHVIKHKPEETASEFLARYRKGYERLLGEMGEEGHYRLIRFDTSRTPIEAIAEEVLNVIRAIRVEPTTVKAGAEGFPS